MAFDVLQTAVTLTPTLGVCGGGIAWVWNQVKTRIAEIKAEHAKAIEKIEVEAERCEARERRSTERHAILVTVIELLWRAVERHDPAAPELKRGDVLMDRYKALGAETERKAD